MNDKILDLLSNLLKALNIFAPNPANTLIKEEKAQKRDIRNQVRQKKADLKIKRLDKRLNKQ